MTEDEIRHQEREAILKLIQEVFNDKVPLPKWRVIKALKRHWREQDD